MAHMGKPPKKAPGTPPPATDQAPARRTGLILGIVALLALAIGAVVYVESTRPEQPAAAEAATPPGALAASVPAPDPIAQPVVPPRPHPQKDFPPLNLPGYPLGRPTSVITAAYRFAAEHPEILTYVPCFCGCERMGHHGNEDCFVKARASNGDVVEWEDHGMECNVCLDVAEQAMQMYASGASVRDIRAAVEAKWKPRLQNHTPTPDPPR
jgi:hypothetical protein